ncbi:ExeM/NucH family extracellular endonuclease [Nocardioides oleivorans]|uniref:ExeM/NucH family extracellular endonuclease n=1 Tax=Nocardioides oleivorans TaxID=273676 RepID=A0A4V1RKE5_9ACTN|nr:ExeM/NucH family extracellular endonuclease [Nocardioides oleivorans]RYB92002.1 ExeM/NucH family extracellular endonuclease [Nocardioides oleivorans]
MRTPAPLSPRHLAAGVGLALLAAGLTPLVAAPAHANPAGTGLVISEVYGAGGFAASGDLPTSAFTHDYIELYNPTSSPVDLSTWAVFYGSATRATGASVSNKTNLTGTIPAHGHYLIQGSGNAANGAPLPTPDVTGSLSLASASGLVILSNQQTSLTPTTGDIKGATGVVDAVGYGTANTFETANQGTVLSGTSAATRTSAGADTDSNLADFTVAAPDPENTSDVDGEPQPTVLEATFPGNKSGQVGAAITPFTLGATGGTSPYTWTATGLPAGVSISPAGQVSGTPTATGTTTVTATATDSATPTAATDDVTFTFTITAAASLIAIAQVQGTGATTPFAGQQVKTQGVVTASYPTGGLNGFYIQTPGGDTVNASDAIFVYGGTSGFATYPAVGDSVEVTGQASEFSGATQISASQSGVVPIGSLGTVTPKTSIPGTECALPGTTCLTGTALDEAREVAEGELFQPTAPWTATDVYDGGPYYSDGTNSGAFRGEIGVVANSSKPLVAPTEVIDAQATAQVAERKAYNDAHRIILDDASSWTYSTTQNADKPFPWFTAAHSVRVGSAITFPKPVVFTFGFNAWRILPQAQVVGDSTGTVDFSQTRPAAPENVGGDVKLATFNVLNFFPTTGEEFVASGLGTCSFYTDRAANPISNNQCNPNGPRGAANDANLVRQRDKIVAAINTAAADIVSLEELENSVKFGKDRDFAINALVTALNADAGAGTWAAVPSPATLPPLAEQDVIRNGFIYKPARVALVGESVVLSDQSSAGGPFEDAREPLAQAFKQVGTSDARAFAVIVNHFKSKGSGTADPFGQGNANDRRILQAQGLVTFADSFKAARGISRVFLAGDFNAYSEEDPIQILKAAGYTNLESTSKPDEETYNFDGMVGSLDHVLANGPALKDVNAVDIWDINGYESVYYEYARFNSNVTNLYAPNPFRSSDHSPEIVGINTARDNVTVTGTARDVVYGKAGSISVKVAPADATGTVVASLGRDRVGSTSLVSGQGTIALAAKSLPVGRHTLTLAYSGDATHKPATSTVTLRVKKAKASISTKVRPKKIKATKVRATIAVTIDARGFTPTGKVTVKVAGETYRATVRKGKAVVRLDRFKKPGKYTAKVAYSGDATTTSASKRITIKVKPRR